MDDLLDRFLILWGSLSQAAAAGLDVIQTIDSGLRALTVDVAAMLEMFLTTGLFVPGETVVLIAAAAVSSVGEGIALAFAITVGALLGQAAGYGFGYAVGLSASAARIRRHAGVERMSSARRFLLRRGGPAILASRSIPILRAVMPFVVGLSGFGFPRFLSWSLPAIAWSAIYLTVYSLAAADLRDGGGAIIASTASVAVGLVTFTAAYVLHYLTERSPRREREVV